jgi:hypothetical protein
MIYNFEQPDPPTKEEWVAFGSFSAIILYTLNYPIACSSSAMITLAFAGIIRLPSFIMGRFK